MNGPEKPYKNNPTANAKEILALLHENSISNGSIKTPDEERIMPATIIDIKVISKMIQL